MFSLQKAKQVLEKKPDYRLEQIKRAVFQQNITNWQDAQGLPKELREELVDVFPLNLESSFFESEDEKTVKALLGLDDGLQIETVLMMHKDGRNTVCVSSQVGCPVGCAFCATGQMGFERNLEPHEIYNQVLLFNRYLEKKEEQVTNIVFMGMGEPFLNYENVMRAAKVFNDEEAFNIGARKISISTVGIPEGIKSLARENEQFNLAVSLHAATNKLRSKLVPANLRYPIQSVMQAVDEYINKTNRKVMFEYIMLRDVNDSLEQASQLARLLKHRLAMVNLIAYNSTTADLKPSLQSRVNEFKELLEEERIKVAIREPFGQDIKAACGQLIS